MEKKRFFTSRNIAFLAVLLALVIVLQLWGSAIPIGATRISLTLVPIVLGAVMLIVEHVGGGETKRETGRSDAALADDRNKKKKRK